MKWDIPPKDFHGITSKYAELILKALKIASMSSASAGIDFYADKLQFLCEYSHTCLRQLYKCYKNRKTLPDSL